VTDFFNDGHVTLDDVIGDATVRAVRRCLSRIDVHGPGSRTLLTHDWCAALARRLASHNAVGPLLPPRAVAVQCTLFDKSAGCNWAVPMHRDLHIPVAERIEHPGLQGWSRKEGAWFVQAPMAVLRQLVALRLQLDPGVAGGGGLAVAPGSHRSVPSPARLDTECVVEQGGVLAMSPLLLHGSRRAERPVRRRVLHFLFGPTELPWGLRWAQAL